MNEKVRARVVDELETALRDFEECDNNELEDDNLIVNVQTVREAIGLLKAKPGTWVYYTNDENKPRWKCNNCGKICRRNPRDKSFCIKCGREMKMEG